MQAKSLCSIPVVGAILFAMASAAPHAHAHALWNMPKPRDNEDGYKPRRSTGFVLPCGVARKPAQPITTLKAGATEMVQWTETVTHPGCFLIEFAKSETDKFEMLSVVKHPNTTKTPQAYMAEIKLPAEPCTDCVLRLRQVMLANNTAACPPANLSDNDPALYYSCANIKLEASGSEPPDAGMPDATSGSGGSGGAGGASGASGSDAGSGSASGGSSGSGGSSASGGAAGGSSASGGSSGSSGGFSGSGGSGGRSNSTGGSSGGSSDDGGGSSGGGCAVGAGSASAGSSLAALLFAALFATRRRRR
jgi:MYXO-CTERM domain-containing protein